MLEVIKDIFYIIWEVIKTVFLFFIKLFTSLGNISIAIDAGLGVLIALIVIRIIYNKLKK